MPSPETRRGLTTLRKLILGTGRAIQASNRPSLYGAAEAIVFLAAEAGELGNRRLGFEHRESSAKVKNVMPLRSDSAELGKGRYEGLRHKLR